MDALINSETTQRTKRSVKKALCAALAVILLLCCAAGGTYAWLIAESEEVVNTFNYGDIDLTLDETKLDNNGNPVDDNGDGIDDRKPEGNNYTMLPGADINKDPKVTVKANSEKCWVFVTTEKIGETAVGTTTYNFDSYLSYEMNADWIELDDGDGNDSTKLYYQIAANSDKDQEYWVIAGNTLKVKEEVTKEMLNALDNNGLNTTNPTYPKLAITAYAVQYTGFEPKDIDGAIITEPTVEQTKAAALSAWDAVKKQKDASTGTSDTP